MHERFQGRGPEKRTLQDAITGRTICQLTRSDEVESKHVYYDLCPWNHDGSQLIYNSAESGHSELYLIAMED